MRTLRELPDIKARHADGPFRHGRPSMHKDMGWLIDRIEEGRTMTGELLKLCQDNDDRMSELLERNKTLRVTIDEIAEMIPPHRIKIPLPSEDTPPTNIKLPSDYYTEDEYLDDDDDSQTD